MESDNLDTVEAFEQLNLEQDIRNYDSAVKILKSLNVNSVRLISNNPRKSKFLTMNGIEVSAVNTHPNIRPENEAYLHSKNKKLGHQIPLENEQIGYDEIRFYHSNQPWGEFSNFSPHSIFIDDINWMTVEHYYQSQKFDNKELKEKLDYQKLLL